MAYYIDLLSIDLDNYREKLKNSYLPPSRMLLKHNIDECFKSLKVHGFKNIKELQLSLKKKDKLTQISKLPSLTEEYLVILLREINNIQPKPTKLSEFTGISAETISKLEKLGLKDTEKLYNKILTKKSRKELHQTTGINEDELLELTKLTDLTRIKWTGATFARMLYHVGVDTVKKASEADHTALHQQINQLKKEHDYFKGAIGLNDMKIFVEAACEVPQEIEY